MDLSRRSECAYRGRTCSHESGMCLEGRYMICNDGCRENSVHAYPPERNAPLPGDGQR
ncbi:MAG: hypothetical protein ABFD98_07450 [Syntrophobacteraceae bacterium]|nr:hypothetical protein [Desulfobacteraceae bacterium]